MTAFPQHHPTHRALVPKPHNWFNGMNGVIMQINVNNICINIIYELPRWNFSWNAKILKKCGSFATRLTVLENSANVVLKIEASITTGP